MKITVVGTYVPRKCGIATFTRNLCDALQINSTIAGKTEVNIMTVDDIIDGYDYNDKVDFSIRQENLQDYVDAANIINSNGTDACIVQHEYGIFGGDSGIYILTLLHHLKVPAVATVHTVLKKPSFLQKLIIQQIAKSVFKMAVMSKMAVEFLKTIYEIPEKKIILIEHGVPDLNGNVLSVKEELASFGQRRILFTFGLLSKNKGIETVIKALPGVIVNHPDILYVVLGNTHPAVVRQSGEQYRESLVKLAEELGVQDHILFLNKFVTEDELFTFLKTIDIYVTPYLNEDQITSGTLSYAIGAGAASVSTPYWHAKELLDNERGKLFPFKDSAALSDILNKLLDDTCKLKTIRKNARQYAQYLKWPNIGARYLEVAEASINEQYYRKVKQTASLDVNSIPMFSLVHIKRLTDCTGILQHAKFGIPNFKEGYCLDDNSRALLMTLMSYQQYRNKEALELMPVYMSFTHYMQKDDGWFRNFLDANSRYLDDKGSEDAFGRAIWSLCYLISNSPNNSYREFALELFYRSLPVFNSLEHLRGIANTLIGICHYLKSYPSHEEMMNHLLVLTKKLTDALALNSGDNWIWFEDKITYDNGILPLALLHSFEITGNTRVKKAALQSLEFLKERTMHRHYLIPVGNNGWGCKETDTIAVFDQQAIETMAMVLMFEQAFAVTNDSRFLNDMNTCFQWFLGYNELHIPLYDPETHGCSDGLHCNGINRNQGAESTLAYLIAHLAVVRTNAKAQQKKYNLPVLLKDYKKVKDIVTS